MAHRAGGQAGDGDRQAGVRRRLPPAKLEASAGFSLAYARTGRNAADLLLAIDAVDLAHRGGVAAVALASNDRDFAPLARWLVERGITVLGLGGPAAPEDWRRSCTRFEEVAPRP